jgi:hypothetical protein
MSWSAFNCRVFEVFSLFLFLRDFQEASLDCSRLLAVDFVEMHTGFLKFVSYKDLTWLRSEIGCGGAWEEYADSCEARIRLSTSVA